MHLATEAMFWSGTTAYTIKANEWPSLYSRQEAFQYSHGNRRDNESADWLQVHRGLFIFNNTLGDVRVHQSRGDDPPLRERHHTPWALNSLSAQALLSMAKWPELRDQIEGMLPRVSKSWLWFKWLGGSLCNLVYYRLSSLWLVLDCMTKYYVRNVGWSFTLFYAFWSSGYIYVAGVRRVISSSSSIVSKVGIELGVSQYYEIKGLELTPNPKGKFVLIFSEASQILWWWWFVKATDYIN